VRLEEIDIATQGSVAIRASGSGGGVSNLHIDQLRQFFAVPLSPAGTPFGNTANFGRAVQVLNGSGGVVTDVEIDRWQIESDQYASSSPLSLSDTGAAPQDRGDYEAYPVRVRRSHFLDFPVVAFNSAAQATALDRCVIDCHRADGQNPPQSHSVIGDIAGDVLFRACRLMAVQASAAGMPMKINADGYARLDHCDLWIAQSGLTSNALGVVLEAGGVFEANHSVIGREVAGPLFTGAGVTTTDQVVLRNNAYANIDPADVSPLAGLETDQELLALDAAGAGDKAFVAGPQYANAPSDMTPGETAAARSVAAAAVEHPPDLDVKGDGYTGRLGSWQFVKPPFSGVHAQTPAPIGSGYTRSYGSVPGGERPKIPGTGRLRDPSPRT